MITLTYKQGTEEVIMSIQSSEVSGVLEAFRRFLLAVGYADYGNLVFEEKDNAVQDT